MVTPKRAALICLHDTNLALRLCDNILLMRDGRIEDSIRPAADSYEVVYNALSKIYGNITLIETAGNYVMSWGCNDTSGHMYDAGTVYDEYMASGKKHLIVTGAIGSGKTTLTKMLAAQYGWIPKFESVDYNPYLADFYEDMARWSFNLQIYFLNKRFKDVVDISKTDDVIIQDRTIYEDARIFAPNLHDMGLMSSRDFDNYSDLFNLMMSQQY